MSRYQCWNCLTHHNGYYKRCDNCISKGCDKPTMWRPGPNYVPPTNADRIRAMSDEELAREINLMFKCDSDWQREFLNWLQQPAEEEGGPT